MRGKGLSSARYMRYRQDHPRLCGEKSSGTLTPKTDPGSPPPMRGKVVVPTSAGTNRRITPAYAGKRFKSFVDGLRIEDHPRLCGEKPFRRKYENFHVGSPPPMRGKARSQQHIPAPDGITPAYAGKRNLCRKKSCRR